MLHHAFGLSNVAWDDAGSQDASEFIGVEVSLMPSSSSHGTKLGFHLARCHRALEGPFIENLLEFCASSCGSFFALHPHFSSQHAAFCACRRAAQR
jgi:hypothetical protein